MDRLKVFQLLFHSTYSAAAIDSPTRPTSRVTSSISRTAAHPRSRELLWRGEGKARLSDDMSKNVELLAKAAEAIIAEFPQATGPLVAVRR